MSYLSFTSPVRPLTTPVFDTFLTQWMPAANGAYVKVYLYLFYHAHHPEFPLETAEAAKALGLLESDFWEAIRYWQDKGAIVVHADGSLSFCAQPPVQAPAPQPEDKKPSPITPAAPVLPVSKLIRVEQKPTYSQAELAIYNRDPQIQNLFDTASKLLGTLSITVMSTLYSFYDYYRLPFDVIDFMMKYCVQNGHREIRYMERVVQDWADHGIQSLESAKRYVSRMDVYRPALMALGLSRYPTEEDCATIDRWQNTLKMPMDLILEACRRTKAHAGSASFAYAESILTRWYQKGITSLAEALKEDEAFQAAQKAKETPKEGGKKPNAFLNYSQHTEIDWDERERELAELSHREASGES